ncbi:MAG: hypothetical protein V1782_12205 [Pseudomonadota bacterium]
MALINTVSHEQAEGIIKEGYDFFMARAGAIPRPLEMLSVSPGLFALQFKRIEYFSKHHSLSFALLAHIRYLTARNLDYGFCMDFNRHILKKLGLTDEDIRKTEADPSQSLLEEKENALLAFVIRAMKAPGAGYAEEIAKLTAMGWQEGDLVDALAQGVSMIDHAVMMQIFEMDHNCLLA